MTAAGNTTTRLLGIHILFKSSFQCLLLHVALQSYIIYSYLSIIIGTFQKVDFVFLVGVGGGVPHYTDYNKHVRLGDVVISHPTPLNKKYTYIYCESAKMNENGSYHFETKEYCPPNLSLQEIAATLKKQVGLLMLMEIILFIFYLYLKYLSSFRRLKTK